MHTIRYWTSHLLALPLKTMEHGRGVKCSLNMLAYLDYIILCAAVTAGLYASWLKTDDKIWLVVGAIGLLLFAFCTMLFYYFGLVDVSSSLAHLWYGCLIGSISLVGDQRDGETAVAFTVTTAMLITSTVLKVFWSALQRLCGVVTHSSRLLTLVEKFQLLGFGIACGSGTVDLYAMWLMVTACAFTLISIRLKTFLSVPSLVVFIVVSFLSFGGTVSFSFNVAAVCCFLVRLFVDPVLDLYFNSLSAMERWDTVFKKHRWIRKVFLVAVVGLQVNFLILAGMTMVYHDEWYFAVPAYLLVGVLWLCLHIVFFVTSWRFTNRITDCNRVYISVLDSSKTLSTIMASKGMRFFALISRNLVFVVYLSTLLLGLVSWQDNNAAFMASWLTVLPMEGVIHGVLSELGSCLGGTCTGYAIVGPSAFCRVDGSPALIPAMSMEEVNSRSISLLNTIQSFFMHHLINIFSCDFSTSGLSLPNLQAKMRTFFAGRVLDGPRFDTYLVYYSGHVYPNGDWALANEESFTFEALLDLWEEANTKDSQSRLIIVQDVSSSDSWLKQVRRNSSHVIALQSCRLDRTSKDPERMAATVGQFTKEWADFNCCPASVANTAWSERENGKPFTAVYATSRFWTDFEFHRPTEEDIEQHWQQSFPRVVGPCVKLLRIPATTDITKCCFYCWNCLKRWKMKWLPPHVINTGHGFKLVRA